MINVGNYPPGSNITILNAVYYRPKDYNENDYMSITYKDLDTGIKYIDNIPNPEFEYHVLKNEAEDLESLSYPGAYYRNSDDYRPVVTRHRELLSSIAKNVGEEDTYYKMIKQRGGFYQARDYFSKHYKVEGTDHNIVDYYMKQFRETYRNFPFDISKAYIDIEADGMYSSSPGLPRPEECPINALTVLFQKERKVFTLLLRDSNNKLIKEFEDEIYEDGNSVLNELRGKVSDCIKDKSLEPRFDFNSLEFNIGFFDNEVELIYRAFELIDEFEPDFVLAWNMAFDIPYIIRRLEVLGYNPAEIMCSKSSSVKFVDYKVDTRFKNEPHKRIDECIIASKSCFLDQMIQFSAINSTKISKYGNWRLDNIGRKVASMSKLEYEGLIKYFPYNDYKNFVFYNIIDTLVQNAIEIIARNIDHIFNKCLNNSTKYAKLHKQSIYLANSIRNDLHDNGYIMCTNRRGHEEKEVVKENDDDEEEDDSYPGAFVADPTMINDYCKMQIHGHPVNIFNNSFDYDYKGLYPHTSIQFNIGHEVMIGKVVINKNVQPDPKMSYKYYDVGSNFVCSIQSQNYLEIGEKYFNLLNISDMMDYINKNN